MAALSVKNRFRQTESLVNSVMPEAHGRVTVPARVLHAHPCLMACWTVGAGGGLDLHWDIAAPPDPPG